MSALKEGIAKAANAAVNATLYKAADVFDLKIEGCIGNQQVGQVQTRKVSYKLSVPDKDQANILVNARTGANLDAYQEAFKKGMEESGVEGTTVTEITSMTLEDETELDIAMRVRGGAFVLAIALLPLWQ